MLNLHNLLADSILRRESYESKSAIYKINSFFKLRDTLENRWDPKTAK